MSTDLRIVSSTMEVPILGSLPRREAGDPPIVIRDTSPQELQFNIMPDRPVTETLRPKEYRVWQRCAEAEFNREYFSSMIQSPDHMVFLTALIQVQRITYLCMCFEFQLPYEPHNPERLKIWPTSVNVEMPKMVTTRESLVHSLKITKIRSLADKRFFAESESNVNGIIKIQASAFIYLL